MNAAPKNGKRVGNSQPSSQALSNPFALSLSSGWKLLISALCVAISVWMFLHVLKIARSSLADPEGDGYLTPSMFYSEVGETPLITAVPFLTLGICFCVAAYRLFRRALNRIRLCDTT